MKQWYALYVFLYSYSQSCSYVWVDFTQILNRILDITIVRLFNASTHSRLSVTCINVSFAKSTEWYNERLQACEYDGQWCVEWLEWYIEIVGLRVVSF